ncbi:PREDICTED: reverse mRNAase [Prunus dulcis]|uniref:PREDICTED: reverse mRNAase n=1 Tax=Prunus dulcis TaxID=3755 RepID=A0A5E4ENT2_PRUDU|nr:hypothetical protein L3X38_034515 [Prunus dulcis]VVA17387.1 PREDICTED: reverse mRNAase [Prunus dulcis]
MGWSEQFLSQVGKEILIKAVAMAMPNYAMSCFKLPVSLCKEIEKDIARYWRHSNKKQKGIHWVSWQRLSLLKYAGGLGFRDLICFNLAMLAKIGWRIEKHPESLLAHVLHGKYHYGFKFLEVGCSLRCTDTSVWRGMLVSDTAPIRYGTDMAPIRIRYATWRIVDLYGMLTSRYGSDTSSIRS